MQKIPILSLPIAVTDYDGAVNWILEHAKNPTQAYSVEAANTHVAALSKHDPSFGEAMSKFDLICPDGMPLIWAINMNLEPEDKLNDRVYGPNLMLETLAATEGQNQYRHFFLGGKPETLEKLKTKFSKSTIAGTYSPPFGEWSEDESQKIIDQIQASNANLIWVGLGCPKQERWIADHKDHLPHGVYFGIGAAFAFHAGEVKQAPRAIQKLGLEWAYRLAMEPRRLFRRYFTYNSLFLYYAIQDQRRG